MVTEELMQSAPGEVEVFVDAIRQHYGTAVAAILFYGSCLRRRNLANEVADFYVIVDSYETMLCLYVLTIREYFSSSERVLPRKKKRGPHTKGEIRGYLSKGLRPCHVTAVYPFDCLGAVLPTCSAGVCAR